MQIKYPVSEIHLERRGISFIRYRKELKRVETLWIQSFSITSSSSPLSLFCSGYGAVIVCIEEVPRSAFKHQGQAWEKGRLLKKALQGLKYQCYF